MKYFILFFLTLSLSASILSAQDLGMENDEEFNANPLTLSLKKYPTQIQPGEQFDIEINLNLAPTYHAYLDKFKLVSKSHPNLSIGKLDISPVSEFEDTFSGKLKKGVKKSATLKALIETPSNLKPGKQSVILQLTYQACTKQHCLFPKKISIPFEWTVVSSLIEKTKPDSNSFWSDLKKAATGETSFKQVAQEGFLFSLIVIFLAGFLTSLTPCIYPMIPITLAVIGAKSTESKKLRSFSLSVVYVLGIAFTFSLLGVFAALSGSLFGSTLSHPAVTFSLAGIFVLLGLSMYGAFEIQAPAFIRNQSSKSVKGYGGAFFTGLVSGVVAGPCVGPVLIGVLAHVGEKQDVLYGFSLLFSYSLGMGIIFLVLGTFSGLAQKVPKAGPWMGFTKFIFGSIMIAMAFYYIEPFISQNIFYILVGSTLVAVSSVFGAFKMVANLSAVSKIHKGIMVTTLSIGILYVALGLFSKVLKSTNMNLSPTTTSQRQNWPAYSDEKLLNAKKNNKPAIIDFSAEWCVACKELEALTFPHPQVLKLSSQFELLKFDATEDSEKLNELREKYNVLGLPTIVFISAKGKVLEELTLTGFEEGPEFAKRMNSALNSSL